MSPTDPPRGQHHKRLAVLTALGLLAALGFGIAGMFLPPVESWWHLLTAPDEDGGWAFVTIDGTDVRQDGYTIAIREREIRGYDNGCNACGFQDDEPMGAPGRTLTCTLVACPPRPHDPLFARFAYGRPAMAAKGDRLVLTLPGHRAELVRMARPGSD